MLQLFVFSSLTNSLLFRFICTFTFIYALSTLTLLLFPFLLLFCYSYWSGRSSCSSCCNGEGSSNGAVRQANRCLRATMYDLPVGLLLNKPVNHSPNSTHITPSIPVFRKNRFSRRVRMICLTTHQPIRAFIYCA